MKIENWLNCHVHAFNYFGGVSKAAHLVQWDKKTFRRDLYKLFPKI